MIHSRCVRSRNIHTCPGHPCSRGELLMESPNPQSHSPLAPSDPHHLRQGLVAAVPLPKWTSGFTVQFASSQSMFHGAVLGCLLYTFLAKTLVMWWNKFRKAVSNMLTWLHANLAGLLRAFISLKWNVTLQGVESFIKRAFFQTYLAPKPFLQEHPLGLMCPRAHFGNYCRS